MATNRLSIRAVAAVLLVTAGGCATPNVWELHDMGLSERKAEAVAQRSDAFCPVVLSNETGKRIEARFQADGVTSMLGLIPAGQSLSFTVVCDAGPIEAFGFSESGFLGGPEEYRTVARVRPDRATRVGLSIANLIR